MQVKELKDKLSFYADALFQAGFERGFAKAIDDVDDYADEEWNLGDSQSAEKARQIVKMLRGQIDD